MDGIEAALTFQTHYRNPLLSFLTNFVVTLNPPL